MSRRCRLVVSVGSFALLALVAVAEERAQPPPRETPSAWRRSTGEGDDFHRALEIRTNDFGGVYEVGQPIPVAVEIRNLGPQDEEQRHPDAQLFPNLDVWIRSASDKILVHKRYDTKIENRISINAGETFVALLDVREILELKVAGEYRISVGHENWFVSDLGDWTGTLASQERIVRIQPKPALK